ncbi:MAG: hypothetical protein ACUVX1_14475 [Chloroflexota bacterium]
MQKTIEVLFRNRAGRVIGRLVDGWLVKSGLRFDKHHLHHYGGWATDRHHIEALVRLGGRGIRLKMGDGTVLESELSDWLAHAKKMGDGGQLYLEDRFWRDRTHAKQLPFI